MPTESTPAQPSSESAELSPRRELSQADLDRFAALSGDDNPIHVDPVHAATTPFRVPVAHGMHLFALVRAELRRRRPTMHLLEQQLKFPSPTPVRTGYRVELTCIDSTEAHQDARPAGRLVERWSAVVRLDDGGVGLVGECTLAGER